MGQGRLVKLCPDRVRGGSRGLVEGRRKMVQLRKVCFYGSRLFLEHPGRFGNVLQEVFLSLRDGQKSVRAQGLQEVFMVKYFSLHFHLLQCKTGIFQGEKVRP